MELLKSSGIAGWFAPLLLIVSPLCGADPISTAAAKLVESQRSAIARCEITIEAIEARIRISERYDSKADEKKIKTLQSTVRRLEAVVAKQRVQKKNTTAAEQALEKANSQLHDATTDRQNKVREVKELSDQLIHARDELAHVKSDVVPRTELISWLSEDEPFGQIKIGDAGTLLERSASVLQVLDESRMLISISRLHSSMTLLLLAPTAGIADGSPLIARGDRLFVVTGTYKYETAAGSSKTVMVIKEVDAKALQVAIAKELSRDQEKPD